LICISFKEPLT